MIGLPVKPETQLKLEIGVLKPFSRQGSFEVFDARLSGPRESACPVLAHAMPVCEEQAPTFAHPQTGFRDMVVALAIAVGALPPAEAVGRSDREVPTLKTAVGALKPNFG